MSRKIKMATLIVIAVALLLPSTAFAWSNGPAVGGVTGNGFGTHDWILDNAIKTAGQGGTWLDYNAALLASDDPDTQSTDSAWHLFRDKGISRGAPYAVGTLYEQAVEAYRAGDVAKASRCIGLLSHYYADVLEPFHTTYDAIDHESAHLSYELAVDDYTRHAGDKQSWNVSRGTQPVSDIRAQTVAAAKFARSKYPDLLSAYGSGGSVNSSVSQITGAVLSRASNDLADIIASVPSAAGVAPAPTAIGVQMSRYNVAQNAKAGALVQVRNDNGAPMEGVGVLLTWQVAGGTKQVLAYTDSSGYAQYYQNVGALPLMQPRILTATASSGGATVAATTTYCATPRLKTGRAGVRTSVSTHHPARGTAVKASTKCISASGKPVAGLKVAFHWAFKGGEKLTYGVTNAKGIARTSLNIRQAPKGYRVKVIGRVESGGSKRSSTATFVPK
ncbi:MAG TPA: zinc dependent phospholipase C family protein [Coriobacteriia bacterium]|nr:zinc dependent phospholipase C family protein [Coriobacteriia bacterium]